MQHQVRLAVLHRNQLFQECLVSVLARMDEFDVVELNYENDDLAATLQQAEVDIILLDLSLPKSQAIEFALNVADLQLQVRLVAIVSAERENQLTEHVGVGFQAWVDEEAPLDELLAAITHATAGEFFCSSTLVRAAFMQLQDVARDPEWRRLVTPAGLTPRELEVLQLVSERLSNKQIAQRLHVSLYTVKNHVHNILDKLSVGNRHEAVEYARWNRWLR